MQISRIALLLISLLCFGLAKAHDSNNNTLLQHWRLLGNKSLSGYFYMLKDNHVFIEKPNHQIISLPLTSFTQRDKNSFLSIYEKVEALSSNLKKEQSNILNTSLPITNKEIKKIPKMIDYVIISSMVGILSLYLFLRRKLTSITSLALASLVMLVTLGFTRERITNLLETSTSPSSIDSAFAPFKSKINTRWDKDYFYVESNGIPDHKMMAGITNWQQQVPIPQCYTGKNAWSIPLNPVVATSPVPVNSKHFLRGAIGIAVNGIPIFNPFTNTGVDALLDGQLDNFGGHCGRADDYHYHIPPLSLYNQIASTKPVAYALDGFAVYGNTEPDGSTIKTLDANHGHYGSNGVYHYHASKVAPYMIGNMVGKVTEDSTLQIIPQASAKPVRPAGTPLKGASITDCQPKANGYLLSYLLGGKNYYIDYTWNDKGLFTFNFISQNDSSTSKYNGSVPCVGVATTSVMDNNLDKGNFLEVFPNPVSNVVSLSLGNDLNTNDVKEVLIYNVKGELVFRKQYFQHNIDLTTFAKGSYLLKLQFDNFQITKKITVV